MESVARLQALPQSVINLCTVWTTVLHNDGRNYSYRYEAYDKGMWERPLLLLLIGLATGVVLAVGGRGWKRRTTAHGGYVGYCEECSPGWEMELIKADATDIIYERGYNRGYEHGYAKAVEDAKNTGPNVELTRLP